jgi:hypothetical protein
VYALYKAIKHFSLKDACAVCLNLTEATELPVSYYDIKIINYRVDLPVRVDKKEQFVNGMAILLISR